MEEGEGPRETEGVRIALNLPVTRAGETKEKWKL